jgi:hypothetical protein
MRALQSFCTLNYFTHDLLHDDTCLFLLGLCPMHCSDLQPRRCQCFHPQVACSTRACVSMNTLGMRLREHPRPPSRVPLLPSCQKIIKYESWFVSRCLWRLSRLMALRGPLMLALWPASPRVLQSLMHTVMLRGPSV